MSDLAAALQVAIRTHAAQVDRQGEPYLLHVLRVVEAVSPEAKVVAALHDVIEDGGPCLAELVWMCLLDQRELHALNLLTRPGDMAYGDYIAEIAANDNALAREVKLADLHDNLGRTPQEPDIDEVGHIGYDEWVREWSGLKHRYEKAIATLEAADRTRA